MQRFGDDGHFVALLSTPLPVSELAEWAVVPSCGAVVTFVGTARDHAGDRTAVHTLTYEAYDEQVVPKLEAVVTEVRARWPEVGRVAIAHRTGELALGDAAVVVAVSTPHRAEAFAAASYAIDRVKATAPIWKKEAWDGGEDWGFVDVAAEAAS